MNITFPNQKTLAKSKFKEFREFMTRHLLANNIIRDDSVRFVFRRHADDERTYVSYTLKQLHTFIRHSLDELLRQGSFGVLGGKPVPQAVVDAELVAEPVVVVEPAVDAELVAEPVAVQAEVNGVVDAGYRADDEDDAFDVVADSPVLARVKREIAEMKARLEAELSIGSEKYRQASSKVGFFQGRNHADKRAQVKMLGALTQAFADVRTACADGLASIRGALQSIEVTARPGNVFPKPVVVELGGSVFSAPDIRAAHTAREMSAFVSHLDVDVMHRLRAAPAPAPAARASSNR